MNNGATAMRTDKDPFDMTPGSFIRHHDDHGIDEIHFVDGDPASSTEDVAQRAFLRLVLVERYKTSDLSGDEWRFSTELQLRRDPHAPWVAVSSGYGTLEAHAKALYPELFGDFRRRKGAPEWVFKRRVSSVALSWKGLPVYSLSYDGEATDLLVTCGHLPWALVVSGEDGASYPEMLRELCAQPGCRKPHAGVYRLKSGYCRSCGGKNDWRKGKLIGFCSEHLRRGDCGRQDSDRNYELVSGVGPDGHEPDPSVVQPSTFGGFLYAD